MTTPLPRIALHLEDGKRPILDPADIYWLEADGDDTWVRHQKGSEDCWEVKLAKPVNRVLPVGET